MYLTSAARGLTAGLATPRERRRKTLQAGPPSARALSVAVTMIALSK